jgi:hypothetical protein
MSFFKNGEQKGKTSPVWKVGTGGSRKDIRKGCRRMNVVEYYVLTHVNGKMRPAETSRNGRSRDKGE